MIPLTFLQPIFISLTSIVKFVAPSLEKHEWEPLNIGLKEKLSPLNYHISRSSNPEDTATLGNQVSIVIRDYLLENPEVFETVDTGKKSKYKKHLSKTIEEAVKLKKELQKKAFGKDGTENDRKRFRQALRAISDLRKAEQKKELAKTTHHQEGQYFKNKWEFSKKACNGTLDLDPEPPGFSKIEADQFYPSMYSEPKIIDLANLSWFTVKANLESENHTTFSTEPIRPKDIRNTLINCNKKSSPGPDGVPYSILLKLPCTHHTLATLYNKVLASGCPPSSWSESVVKLLHKKGPTNDPTNFRMIALTNCVGKIYHLILSGRFTKYLTENNLIDKTLQKAFLPGINGCIEHNLTLDELVKDAKQKKRTLHITFIDLADAFGSVPHNLITHSLQRYKFPPEIILYIHNFYSNLQATVHTRSFKTQNFSFKRGVFQGDPLSPIIFLVVFNPIIEFLEENSKFGYKMQEENTITLPYADDFCLITTDLRTHRRLLSQISEKINTMGLKIKPSKCRSFSLKSGSPSKIYFKIEENVIPSIADEEQKFLGRLLFFSGKSEECFKYLKETITTKLDNLDSTAIRSEFKLEIYKMYILPSIRFLLTVHDLPKTHLEKLDTHCDQYLKKWAGLPRSATTSLLHLNTALDIKKISTLYYEAHTVTHTSTRLRGDYKVNQVLDNRLVRESEFTRKQSVTVLAEANYLFARRINLVQGEIPTNPEDLTLSDQEVLTLPGEGGQSKFISEVKADVKAKVLSDENQKTFLHVQSLIQQGKFLELTYTEQNDATWKSYIFNLPRGTMKWLLNSSINTLPTKANLKLWGKVSNDKCHCGRKQTLNHILSCCKKSLEDGRFTFRHNNILKYIHTCLDHTKFKVYVDIEGSQTAAGGTLPPEVLVTNLKPDIVIIDRKTKTVEIFELTVPGEHRIEISNKLKTEKYEHFLRDITSYKPSLSAFEIGAQTGYINNQNKKTIGNIHKYCQKNIKLKSFTNNTSAITALSSYYIFNCRNFSDWEQSDYISAPFPNQ